MVAETNHKKKRYKSHKQIQNYVFMSAQFRSLDRGEIKQNDDPFSVGHTVYIKCY